MQVPYIDYEFPTGQKVVLVGKKQRKNKVIIDGISLDSAYSFSDEVYLIDHFNIEPEDQIIYLIGHGKKGKARIENWSLDEIADRLIAAGWDGQAIYMASDYSAMPLKKRRKNACRTACKELDDKLKERLERKLRDDFDGCGEESFIEQLRTMQENVRYVFSDAAGPIIIVNENNEAKVYVVQKNQCFDFPYMRLRMLDCFSKKNNIKLRFDAAIVANTKLQKCIYEIMMTRSARKIKDKALEKTKVYHEELAIKRTPNIQKLEKLTKLRELRSDMKRVYAIQGNGLIAMNAQLEVLKESMHL